MTRGKQIIEEAKRIIAEAHERGNNDPMVDLAITLSFSLGARWADAHPEIDVRTMAAWQSGYKEAIEKACEWLEKQDKTLDADKVIAWLVANILNYEFYVKRFKKDFGL